jgi:parvulin-like peptidyl-prolyl isomerase
MDQHRPRWRFRISTVMLLVVIVALAIALVMERRRRQVSEEMALRRLEAERIQAVTAWTQARRAEAALRKALDEAKSPDPGPPGESSGRAKDAGR